MRSHHSIPGGVRRAVGAFAALTGVTGRVIKERAEIVSSASSRWYAGANTLSKESVERLMDVLGVDLGISDFRLIRSAYSWRITAGASSEMSSVLACCADLRSAKAAFFDMVGGRVLVVFAGQSKIVVDATSYQRYTQAEKLARSLDLPFGINPLSLNKGAAGLLALEEELLRQVEDVFVEEHAKQASPDENSRADGSYVTQWASLVLWADKHGIRPATVKAILESHLSGYSISP